MRGNRLLALLILCFSSLSIFASSKPNIVFILADDWGMGDIRFYGGERCKIDTPNMDALAAQGMAFTNAHSSSSVCTPSRYSVLTGRYNWRSERKNGVLNGTGAPLILPARETVASLLQTAGYATACIGKWHLGLDLPTTDGTPPQFTAKTAAELATKCNIDWSGRIGNSPVAVGFDYFWGISASLDMPPYIWIENDRFVGECTTIKAFNRPGPAHADFEAIDVLPTLVEKATGFISAQSQSDQPFFLYMPLNSPHTPIVPSVAFQGKSALGAYGDFVMETDWAVGAVVAALEKAGLAENTLIIVTADNGCSPASSRGIPEGMLQFTMEDGVSTDLSRHYPSITYRGHKADIYEGGHRVPFVARWDGTTAPGSVAGQPICLVDLFATCAEMVGVEVSATSAEDSISFLPILTGATQDPIRTDVVHHSINGSFSLRQGSWKMVFCPGSGGWSAPRPQTFKKVPTTGWYQLFDLENDPSEQTNVIVLHPETAERMTQLMQQYIAAGRSTPGAPQPNDGLATPLHPDWMIKAMGVTE